MSQVMSLYSCLEHVVLQQPMRIKFITLMPKRTTLVHERRFCDSSKVLTTTECKAKASEAMQGPAQIQKANLKTVLIK